MKKKQIIFFVMSIAFMLVAFNGSNVKAEESLVGEQQGLIDNILVLNENKNQLIEDFQHINVDENQTGVSVSKTIESTYMKSLELVDNEIMKLKELVKNKNLELMQLSYSFDNNFLGDETYFWPVEGFTSVSQEMSSSHNGIDINTLTSNPRALNVQNGIVIIAEDSGDGYGNKVVIYHGNNTYSLYAHLDSITVEAGSFLLEGEEVGFVGNTGNSSGNHLHFELYSINGNGKDYQNPLDYLKR